MHTLKTLCYVTYIEGSEICERVRERERERERERAEEKLVKTTFENDIEIELPRPTVTPRAVNIYSTSYNYLFR